MKIIEKKNLTPTLNLNIYYIIQLNYYVFDANIKLMSFYLVKVDNWLNILVDFNY